MGKNVAVAVVGGGAAGLTAAIALAGAGLDTALIARPPTSDNRTTALLASSVAALETLGVWPLCACHAAALKIMRIVDDTRRLWRAPEVRFDAGEIGLDAFGHNIANRHLLAALDAKAATLPALTRISGEVAGLESRDDGVIVTLTDNQSVSASLVVAADGARSLCREAAGIAVDSRRYPQTALTFDAGHTRPHDLISTEFHTESGPFTLVPLPGLHSSIVCVVDPEQGERLRALNDAALAAELEQRSHSILGKITVSANRGAFPLSIQSAQSFGARRVALVGEAAHVLPPIGAQGLNLGLRDAAALGEMVVAAHRAGEDVGGPGVLARYDAARRPDIGSRTIAVDLLNRSLLTDFLPVQGARGIGLFLMDRVTPLRRAVMRNGVAPSVSQPRLMRGEAL